MRKIREVLRLRLEADLSVRQISVSVPRSVSAPSRNSSKCPGARPYLALPTELDDGRLAALSPAGRDTTISARHVVPGLALRPL